MNNDLLPTHSLFEQPWWLDATAPNTWDAVEIEEDGRVVARLPFTIHQRFGLRVLSQPPLTQTLGFCIASTPASRAKQSSREHHLVNKLIDGLPKHDVFQQNFHSNVTDWLPFYWRGFEQTTRYSFVHDDISDIESVLKAMDKAARNTSRKAERSITVVSSNTVEEVLDMAELTFKRQGLRLPYSRELLERIDDAAKMNGHRAALYGVDDAGRIHSAAYVVGDERRAYLLASGVDPEVRHSGSGNLVTLAAIRAAANFSAVFDFEGSMIAPIAKFYRSFGARLAPYSSITGKSRRARRAIAVQQLIRG